MLHFSLKYMKIFRKMRNFIFEHCIFMARINYCKRWSHLCNEKMRGACTRVLILPCTPSCALIARSYNCMYLPGKQGEKISDTVG